MAMSMSISPETIVIPARSFYCQNKSKTQRSSLEGNGPKLHAVSNSSPKSNARRSLPNHPNHHQNQSCIHTNKGVKHKIRRRYRSNDGLTQRSTTIAIDSILRNMQNDNLRHRIESERTEKQQIRTVHDILRQSQNPIELARPLRGLNMSDDSNNNIVDGENDTSSELINMDTSMADFSDSDGTDDEKSIDNGRKLSFDTMNGKENSMSSPVNDSIDTISRPETPNEHRKFFKTGRSATVPKEVRITENIKALVFNGRMTLISEKKKLPKRPNIKAEFSNAQAAVDVIIKNLDDQKKVEISDGTERTSTVQIKEEEPTSHSEINSLKSYEYSRFKTQIPYFTDDPVTIEEQKYFLDFLISHGICNEETFDIFIADPENHIEEATKIINDIFGAAGPELDEKNKLFLEFISSRNILPAENLTVLRTDGKENSAEANVQSNVNRNLLNVEKDNSNKENSSLNSVSERDNDIKLGTDCVNDTPSESSSNSQNLYPLFYPGQCQPLTQKSTRKNRIWHRGYGLSQYQIDAGQKEYGAKQCKQCGLVYGVHEPEEEKLHRDFHSSLHVLRFKGWIDEDCVADYPEWGRDGRIIRITDSTNAKRRERLKEIIKIVDKELGFSSYIIPKTFVAYLAIRNGLIVGFSLVQPLSKANKYILCNGVDCCTIDEFDAKCGISRIWVAPLYRRLHVGKKLIQAVRMNTIAGEEISLNEIAFSAPTEEGKVFAQKVSGTENFLVYQ